MIGENLRNFCSNVARDKKWIQDALLLGQIGETAHDFVVECLFCFAQRELGSGTADWKREGGIYQAHSVSGVGITVVRRRDEITDFVGAPNSAAHAQPQF